MKKSELWHLINRIAEEVISPEEATSVVQALSGVIDWDTYIANAREQYIRREQGRVANAVRRAKEKGLPHTLTLKEWLETIDHFEGRCAYCQERFSYEHLEHFFPLAGNRFGTTADNCVPSCRRCNRYKGTLDVDYWLSQQALFEGSFHDLFRQSMLRVYKYLRSRAPKVNVWPVQASWEGSD